MAMASRVCTGACCFRDGKASVDMARPPWFVFGGIYILGGGRR